MTAAVAGLVPLVDAVRHPVPLKISMRPMLGRIM